MAKIEFLVIVAFAALASCTDVEDADQKKRGAGKGNALNSIPTGGQKQDYTYNIYAQNTQSAAHNPYQPQLSNSFYPNQANQYYAPSTQADPSGYVQQPQINYLPPTQSQFVPINFVPNPGYQSKYQIVPQQSKGGNIQLAIVSPSNNFQTPSLYPSYQQNFFSPNPTSPAGPHQNFLSSLSSGGQFNVGQNLPLSLGNSYLGQPSTMVLLAQPNSSPYGNLLYNNPYNYFQSGSQPKYGVSFSQPSSELQVPANVAKEENEISSHTSEYTGPSESSSSYKPSFVTSRSSYSKH